MIQSEIIRINYFSHKESEYQSNYYQNMIEHDFEDDTTSALAIC